jgi:glycosyltransferase involved in cell wall biosynthesis
MNILYVTSFAIPHLGGLSRVLLSEADRLAGSHNIRIVCAKPRASRSELASWGEDGIEISYVASPPVPLFVGRLLRSILIGRWIRRDVKTSRVDVISAHDVYGALACVIAGVQRLSLLTLHSTYSTDRFVMMNRIGLVPILRRAILMWEFIADYAVEVFCYNLVRGIICVSEIEEQDARRKTDGQAKTYLIRNAIDTTRISHTARKREEARSRLDIPRDAVVFLFAGRMVPKNGPFVIAKAIPFVVARSTNSVFVFVGDGPERPICENYLAKLRVLSNVRFVGEKETLEILPIADVFISHVSSLVKGVGLVVLEALASGIPTIVGEDELTSRLFRCGLELICVKKDDPAELGERMISLINDPERRCGLSVAGRRKALADFSLADRINRIERLFLSVAEA